MKNKRKCHAYYSKILGSAQDSFGLFIFRVLFVSLFIIHHPSFILADSGSNSADYLKVNVGAKAVAMAGTQFGALNDSFAQFYNPALLSGIKGKEIGLMHNEFFLDFRQEVFTYVHPTVRFGNFATAINYFTFGAVEGFNAQGVRQSNLSANALLIGVSWGKDWYISFGDVDHNNFSTGATFKFLNDKLDDDTVLGFAFDLGFSYSFILRTLNGLKVAGSLMNFGAGAAELGSLPRIARLGLAYSFWGEALTATLDEVFPMDSPLYPALGIQYKIRKMFSVRMGYSGNVRLDQEFTYGIGLENPLFRLDYSFVPYDDLGDTHRFSLLYRFGRSSKGSVADNQLREKVTEARTLYNQGFLVKAYMIAQQVQRVAPWLKANNRLLSNIQKDFQALEDADRREKMQGKIGALFNRAERLFEEGNLISAQQEFQAVLGLQPDHVAARGYIGHIESQFRSFVQSFYKDGIIAFAQANYEKAKELFEKVLAMKQDHRGAKEQLARCLEILERRKNEASEGTERDNPERTYRDGQDAFRNKNFEETLFKQHMESGRDFLSTENWESAVKDFKKALNLLPSSEEAKNFLTDAEKQWGLEKKALGQKLYQQGVDAFMSGRKNEAKSLWQRAVDLDPENKEAQRGLAKIAP